METPSQLKRRQKRHTFFVTLIILTVPLYILGFAILQMTPNNNVDENTLLPSEAPPKVSTILPRTTPTQKSISPTSEMIKVATAAETIILISATTNQHISGTCKMGPDSDEHSVVDQYGKVNGVDNLRVIDASIMPDCIRANTNVTTMMIAERMVDLIK